MLKLLIIILFKILLTTTDRESDRTFLDVEIDQGIVRGYKERNYYKFLGIPYAAAPTGKNRFKAPLPPPNWTGIFHANRTVLCPQENEFVEDCLVINIYVPCHRQNFLSPLLFNIHGGAFILGGGVYKKVANYEYFSEKGIIVVTFNYRLGALGFLCLGTDEAPGNAGLKDQIAALKWVKSFIGAFGGDSNRITISGTSAGGASVELLVLSPLSKGLFNNAIVESGSATTVWAVDYEPVETAKRIAKNMGYNETNFTLSGLGKFYETVYVKDLIKHSFEDYDRRTDGTFGFVPCLERFSENAFMTQAPLDRIESGNFLFVPILYIFVNGEGFFRQEQFYKYSKEMNENFSAFLPADLSFKNDKIKYEISNRTKLFYFGNRSISIDTGDKYINYLSDTLFIYAIVNSAKNVAFENPEDVYLLEFTYEGDLKFANKTILPNVRGAGHVDSLCYVFFHDEGINEEDRNVVEIMTEIWTNFIKYGSPNMPQWLPMKPDFMTYVQVDETLIYHFQHPYQDRMEYWDQLYKTHRKCFK